MTRNMGTADRVVRAVIGVALLVATFVFGIGTGWAHWAMAAAGLVLLATAATGFCPPYALFGIRTCKA